jgi:CHAT domain-containing protein/pYEATS domain-containing protein involved in immunity
MVNIYLNASKVRKRLPQTGARGTRLRGSMNDDGLLNHDPKTRNKLNSIGSQLFDSIVTRANAETIRKRAADEGIRIWVISKQNPQAQSVPWELLCDHELGANSYLACSRKTPVVRAMARPSPSNRLPPIDGPLRILVVSASPKGTSPLAVRKETTSLRNALAQHERQKLVDLGWVSGRGTAEKVRDCLREGWHVFHFIGHGDVDEDSRQGYLAFEDASGEEDRKDASELKLLMAQRGIRLAVFNSCRGALAHPDGLYTDVASRVAQSVPAVIGMQTAITDGAAVEFSSSFYEALVEGLSVEEAVSETRVALQSYTPRAGEPRAIEWPAPVLYLSTSANVLSLGTIRAKTKRSAKQVRERKKRRVLQANTKSNVSSVPPAPEDDPNKYQFRGQPSRNGRTLSATVRPDDGGWYQIKLEVRADSQSPRLTGSVAFHLHDTFADPVRVVSVRDGRASIRVLAWGAFTVGAEVDNGKTRLELDLAELKSAPRAFRER